MSDGQQNEENHTLGEKTGSVPAAHAEWTWIKDGVPISAGSLISQHHLTNPAAQEFAALHLIRNDLQFAVDCFVEADKLGVPDATHTLSKALVFSGTVAYARCFGEGVRPIKLKPDDLKANVVEFSSETHDYLVALRSKHVAHSVNAFERCDAFGVVVMPPGEPWHEGNAVGVAFQFDIGMNRAVLRAVLAHIRHVHAWVIEQIAGRRHPLYDAFKGQFTPGTVPRAVPILVVPNLQAVTKRR